MSLINAAAPYRRDDRQTVRVPVVMPLVEVDVDDQGYLSVTLDGEPYSADRSLTRTDLIAVAFDDPGLESRAVDLLRGLGAHHIERAKGNIVDGDWADFDPASPPDMIH